MRYTEFPLDDRLQRALATAGFVSPTPIQAAALPVAMAGRDLVGTAQTGTGKTAAFVLPILQRLIALPLESRKTRAVILAPTRELVEQILAMVRELGIHTNVRTVAVYGGVAMHQQTRALRNGVELVIACPGRLLDHINRRNTDFRQLDCLVLDEADRMLDMGFLPSIQEILEHVPDKRQTMLYSATFPRSLNAFVQQTLRDPVRVEVDTAVPAQTVRHTLYQVNHGMKTAMLTSLLRQLIPDSDSVLIFTQTRVTANQVAADLYAAGMHADVLHAEKTQRARQDTLDQFRAGVFPYLVATDIAARGIDVTSISHVINYDIPGKADDYLHRIGRTGRMERAGHAISLMTRGDIRSVREIERMLGKRIEIAQLENDSAGMNDDGASPHDDMARPRAATRAASHPSRRQDEERPRCAPRRDTPMASAGRADRPERARHADAPRNERSDRRSASDAPARAARPGKHHVDAAPPRADHSQRRHDTEPLSRKERRRIQFGENPTARSPQSEPVDRRHRDGEATSAPRRREHAAEHRDTAAAPSETPRRERSGGKHFTGMAAVARHNRKFAGTKRQPGEVSSGPRPHAKAAATHQSAAVHATHAKRQAGRGR